MTIKTPETSLLPPVTFQFLVFPSKPSKRPQQSKSPPLLRIKLRSTDFGTVSDAKAEITNFVIFDGFQWKPISVNTCSIQIKNFEIEIHFLENLCVVSRLSRSFKWKMFFLHLCLFQPMWKPSVHLGVLQLTHKIKKQKISAFSP